MNTISQLRALCIFWLLYFIMFLMGAFSGNLELVWIFLFPMSFSAGGIIWIGVKYFQRMDPPKDKKPFVWSQTQKRYCYTKKDHKTALKKYRNWRGNYALFTLGIMALYLFLAITGFRHYTGINLLILFLAWCYITVKLWPAKPIYAGRKDWVDVRMTYNDMDSAFFEGSQITKLEIAGEEIEITWETVNI